MTKKKNALALDLTKIPNRLLGTCLTDKWVQEMENLHGLDISHRDHHGRLVHPFLHVALKYPRFQVDDYRTGLPIAFGTCAPAESRIYGYGAKYSAQDNKTIETGVVNGTLVLELNERPTHTISSMVFAILAAEVYGYPVSFYYTDEKEKLTQRMSHIHTGLCTPTHVSLGVSRVGIGHLLDIYSNETFQAGSIGFGGRSGLYTTTNLIQDGLNRAKHQQIFFAEFWKDYKYSEELQHALRVSTLWNNTAHFPPKQTFCADGFHGCLNHCSKSHACTLREKEKNGKECLVVIMMDPLEDPGFFQAMVSNVEIPAYFCFLGLEGAEAYIIEAKEKKNPVLFYHFEPDTFHLEHPNAFERVYFPPPISSRLALATDSFGENGYDQPTTNPVNVDFPYITLSKYAADVLTDAQPIGNLVTKFSITDENLEDMLNQFIQLTSKGAENNPERHFYAACQWTRDNYNIWKHWMDHLPLCTYEDHVKYELYGCNESQIEIRFKWNQPDPTNVSRPYNCDGGLLNLPDTYLTTHTCEWLQEDPYRWMEWVLGEKPECSSAYYNYTISGCFGNRKRTVQYYWYLPTDDNLTLSKECVGGDMLPADFLIECEYMPSEAQQYIGITTLASILAFVYLIAMGLVFKYRTIPIIKRSQFELLLVMLTGAILMSGATIVYGGQPSDMVCGLRPILISIGFTLIFGSLFVKSYRVYRVFMSKAMKKIKVTAFQMVNMLSIFLLVDILILITWYATDFPGPTHGLHSSHLFEGLVVDTTTCKSSNFLFSALLIFWKSLMLFAGLYLSFLIRNVSSDFQESVWIFASAVVVLMGGLIILPLAYLVDLGAPIFYMFLSSMLLFCTATVVALMLVPKFLKSKAVSATTDSSATSVTHSVGSSEHHRHGSNSQSHGMAKSASIESASGVESTD